jgi:SAM-dependent methyltransferase
MWDFVVVDDPEQREKLGRLSLQVLTAPVSIFVAYGKEFSEEGHANVQSAAAALMTMSLAAHVLGLGTFWINQLGPRDQVGAILGLPPDREVVAALAVGWPKVYPTLVPRRRAFEHVVHWNHFGGRPIPSSPRPADWTLDLIRDYQHARVLNGNRYNKPKPWDLEAALGAANRLAPRNDDGVPGDDAPRWLDVLPLHGVFTSAMSRQHRSHRWAVLELSADVAQFAAKRCPSQVRCEALVWDPARPDALPAGAFDCITVLQRLEALPPDARLPLLTALARALRPGGRLLLEHTSPRSFHTPAQWLHERRGGPGGVEYVLAPDPNLGPWQAIPPAEVERLLGQAGLRVLAVEPRDAAPSQAETDHRTRNMRGAKRVLLRGAAAVARGLGALPGVARLAGRTRRLICERG